MNLFEVKVGTSRNTSSCRAERQECGRKGLMTNFAILAVLEPTSIAQKSAELSKIMRSS